MTKYNAEEVVVTMNGVECKGFSCNSTISRKPSFVVANLWELPANHPYYSDRLVKVCFNTRDGYFGSFALDRDSPYLAELLASDPYSEEDVIKIKLQGECE